MLNDKGKSFFDKLYLTAGFFVVFLILLFTIRSRIDFLNLDSFFYESIVSQYKTATADSDIVLVEIPHENTGQFRKDVGQFLKWLAPYSPKTLGLDIRFRKFDTPDSKESKDANASMREGIKALFARKIPVVAAYSKDDKPDYYDSSILNLFTNSGHVNVAVDNREIFFSVFEDIKSDSKVGIERKPFLGILIAQYGFNKGDDYPYRLKIKYGDMIVRPFLKKPGFKTYEFLNDKLFNVNLTEGKSKIGSEVVNSDNINEIFAGKIVIVGSFGKDYKKAEDYYGMEALAYTVQCFRYDDEMIRFEYRLWIIISVVLGFSLVEVLLLRMFRKKSCMVITSPRLNSWVSFILSSLATLLIFIACVKILSLLNYLYTDVSLTIYGVVAAGLLFGPYRNKYLSKVNGMIESIHKIYKRILTEFRINVK
ncbi:MAG: CHASE2 domain-containing protein [Nitrospirae bacterium]|nr:CHASE2 domain-containing protein [Nitrospirota bacterium]